MGLVVWEPLDRVVDAMTIERAGEGSSRHEWKSSPLPLAFPELEQDIDFANNNNQQIAVDIETLARRWYGGRRGSLRRSGGCCCSDRVPLRRIDPWG